MSEEYIKRENIAKYAGGLFRNETDEKPIGYLMSEYQINSIPSEDVAPVRHGHWIEDQDRIVCSECGSRFRDEIIYMQENKPGYPHRCLECGAIMDQEVPTNG